MNSRAFGIHFKRKEAAFWTPQRRARAPTRRQQRTARGRPSGYSAAPPRFFAQGRCLAQSGKQATWVFREKKPFKQKKKKKKKTWGPPGSTWVFRHRKKTMGEPSRWLPLGFPYNHPKAVMQCVRACGHERLSIHLCVCTCISASAFALASAFACVSGCHCVAVSMRCSVCARVCLRLCLYMFLRPTLKHEQKANYQNPQWT